MGIHLSPINHGHLLVASIAFRTGSFRKAARELGVKGSTISRKAGELEESLGFPVFVRLRTGVELTIFGIEFLFRAEAALEAFQKALERKTAQQ